MSRAQVKLAEVEGLLPELPAPEHLRKRCEEMQGKAAYLGLGYKKGKLDAKVHDRLLAHFGSSVERFSAEERMDELQTIDRKIIPSMMCEDQKFNAQLAEDLKPLHEAWAGTPLLLSACYGIRCYQRGSFLHNHVDRQPHFVSSTICIDYDLASPWPLHIESIDGTIDQVHLEPGEYVLYEGCRLAHGRPYPLDGEFYAGIFAHYYPASMPNPTVGG